MIATAGLPAADLRISRELPAGKGACFVYRAREKQMSIYDYLPPYHGELSGRNRWVQLAAAIANALLEQLVEVAFTTPNDLTAAVRATFGKDRGEEEQVVGFYQRAPLLVLDDLGTEFTSAFTLSTVYNLLNTRKKPTIISSNLTVKELQEKYSQRVVSRLFSQFTYLRFVGKDIRQLRSRNF